MDKISDIIVENNNQFLVMNKPFGMPVQDDLSGDDSLLKMAQNYCKHPVHILNRLDRPVGGLVVFSKKLNTHAQLSKQKILKKYIALVEGKLENKEGVLTHFLKKNGKLKKAFCSDVDNGGKKSTLKYKVLKELEKYTVLEIGLETGRFHQIRSQMGHIGHPIKGDVKYGARRKNQDRSINLIAYYIELQHPVSHKKMNFNADFPEGDSLWSIVKETMKHE